MLLYAPPPITRLNSASLLANLLRPHFPVHVSCACWFVFIKAVDCGSGAGEASTSLILLGMDSILRQLEGLSRDELVWLTTYLTGRLRALPPTGGQPVEPMADSTSSPACTSGKGEQVNTAMFQAPATSLPERIEALNFSMDPWECTGAAPQGWATHLRQSLVPIQVFKGIFNYAQAMRLLSHNLGKLPGKEQAMQEAPRRQGKASRPVSIFASGVPRILHILQGLSFEQRRLNPAGIPMLLGGLLNSLPVSSLVITALAKSAAPTRYSCLLLVWSSPTVCPCPHWGWGTDAFHE